MLHAGATAQQLNPTKQLLVSRNGADWNVFRSAGTIASAEEMCAVLSHPLFRRPLPAYRALDSINSDFRWEGIEAAPLWIEKMFQQAGIARQRLSVHPDSLRAAEQQLSACLAQKESEHPDLYRILTSHFLHYLGPDCHKPVYETRKTVDNSGNLTETKIVVGKPLCINFNYNSGDYGGWNSTTFALMLMWKEAHPVLNTVFTRGDAVLQSRLDEQLRKDNQARAEADERRRLTVERTQEAERKWQEYASRQKSLLEQVFNFATNGDANGSPYERWIEAQPCVMTNGRREIDVRQINMTAFRINREVFGNTTYIVSSDGKVRLSTSRLVPIDRLQNAWALAFKECPGVRSRF